MSEKKRVAIIGAGLAGLVAAYELRNVAAVTVFEAEDRIGGKLRTVPFKAGPVDMGAEAYLARREDATEFIQQLGLGDSLRYPSGLPSAVYAEGALHSMPRGTLMGIPAKGETVEGICSAETVARIAAEGSAEPISWTPGQDMSVGALVRSRYGDEVVEKLVDPLLGGVYSCLADDLSVRATVPKLAKALDEAAQAGEPVTLSGAVASVVAGFSTEAASGNGGTRPVFATFATGYHEFYDALAEQSGAEIYVDSFISSIKRETKGASKGAANGTWSINNERFDAVILAVPAPTAAGLLRGVDRDLAATVGGINLASSAVVGFAFADDSFIPQNSGILVATKSDLHAKAFTFWSRKWPHVAERGGAVVRVSFGRLGDDALVRAEEDTLVDLALEDLSTVLGVTVPEPAEIFVQRWYGGLPHIAPGHQERVKDIESALATSLPGMYVAGAWTHGVGVPDIIASTRELAQSVADYFETGRSNND
ncbi:MAG: protoporphyrinogen oxidase [Corynebacterium sp.]|nr:protoporphyrinogen oxidase [Corynebacterium sp.]